MSGLLQRAQQFTAADEPVRYAITGQTGTKPTWRYLSFWLIVANKARIIVITPNRIMVLKAGQLRSSRTKPKSFLFELPRATYLGPHHGSWSKLQLGNEGIWVARNSYQILEKANAEAGLTGPAPTAAPVR